MEQKLSRSLPHEPAYWHAPSTDMSSMDFHTTWPELVWLFVLPIAIASVSWTVTREDIFRELREYCIDRSQNARSVLVRKFFYIGTCEYCFSHYITLAFLLMTGCQLLLADWRGSIIAFFALAGVANIYLGAYARLRVDIKAERVQIEAAEKEMETSAGQTPRGRLRRVSEPRPPV